MTNKTQHSLVTIGIDVGGHRKGFHAVALADGAYYGKQSSPDEQVISQWCKNIRASVIAIDAPCRWRNDACMRLCESELKEQGISCFATPSREKAENHRTNYYGWMLRGECLYEALKAAYPLMDSFSVDQPYCFETFPHAITWHLRGGNANAKKKGSQRRQLLEEASIDSEEITNIDLVDAALCALTAHKLASGCKCCIYGDAETGLIVVPERKN